METHIAQTVAALDDQIAALQSTRGHLVKLFGAAAPAQPVVAGPKVFTADHPRALNLKLKSRKQVVREQASKGLTVCAVFRQCIAGFKGEFTNEVIRNDAMQRHPEMKNKIRTATGTTLSFLEEKGEIVRIRKEGRSSVWIRGKVQPPVKSVTQSLHEQIHSEIGDVNGN